MKSSSLILLIAFVLGSTGCMRQRESKFFHSFTMKQLATDNRSYGLTCDGGGGGGGGSTFAKAFLFGGSTEYHASRSDSAFCKMNPGKSLDEPALVVALARDVASSVKSSGLSVVETGQKDPRSSFVEYAGQDCKGRIEVSLTNMYGGQISLNAKLDENGH
jgi:hypothetical protein